jgi:CMP-N,N'-diacetyllegionaminic acid synthase
MSFRKKKVIAIIPAKKNSTRLRNKNIKKINKLRLFEISVINALKSKIIDEVYVSSNSDFILNKSKKLGARILNRPNALCKKNIDANKVILHFIDNLNSKIKSSNPYLIYLQPTSPLRRPSHIDKSFRALRKSFNSLVSVSASDKGFYKSLNIKGKKIQPLFPKFFNANDQQIPQIYKPNGAIYIFLLKDFLKKRKIPIKNLGIYIMSEKESLDINSLKDFKIAKKIMNTKKS